MDVEFWIYIVIGVIYFLSRLLKKPEQPPGPSPEPERPARRPPLHTGQSTSERPKQLTFEELLREITEGKQAQRRPPEPEPAYQRYEGDSYEEDIKDEARSLEQAGIDEAEDARIFRAYEDAKNMVFERKSLEETLHLEDTKVDFEKFKPFARQKEKRFGEEYMKLLRNPMTLKQAVVMSEILKRKF